MDRGVRKSRRTSSFGSSCVCSCTHGLLWSLPHHHCSEHNMGAASLLRECRFSLEFLMFLRNWQQGAVDTFLMHLLGCSVICIYVSSRATCFFQILVQFKKKKKLSILGTNNRWEIFSYAIQNSATGFETARSNLRLCPKEHLPTAL